MFKEKDIKICYLKILIFRRLFFFWDPYSNEITGMRSFDIRAVE